MYDYIVHISIYISVAYIVVGLKMDAHDWDKLSNEITFLLAPITLIALPLWWTLSYIATKIIATLRYINRLYVNLKTGTPSYNYNRYTTFCDNWKKVSYHEWCTMRSLTHITKARHMCLDSLPDQLESLVLRGDRLGSLALFITLPNLTKLDISEIDATIPLDYKLPALKFFTQRDCSIDELDMTYLSETALMVDVTNAGIHSIIMPKINNLDNLIVSDNPLLGIELDDMGKTSTSLSLLDISNTLVSSLIDLDGYLNYKYIKVGNTPASRTGMVLFNNDTLSHVIHT